MALQHLISHGSPLPSRSNTSPLQSSTAPPIFPHPQKHARNVFRDNVSRQLSNSRGSPVSLSAEEAAPSSSRGRRAAAEDVSSSSLESRSPELLLLLVEVISGERPQRQRGSGGWRRPPQPWCGTTRYEVEVDAAGLGSEGDGGESRKLMAICMLACGVSCLLPFPPRQAHKSHLLSLTLSLSQSKTTRPQPVGLA